MVDGNENMKEQVGVVWERELKEPTEKGVISGSGRITVQGKLPGIYNDDTS